MSIAGKADQGHGIVGHAGKADLALRVGHVTVKGARDHPPGEILLKIENKSN